MTVGAHDRWGSFSAIAQYKARDYARAFASEWVERSDTHHGSNDGDGFREASTHPTICCPTGRFICLTGKSLGQFIAPVSSLFCKNILIFRRPKSLYTLGCPVPQRGGSRSSRTRGGMRWTQGALETRALSYGRRSRVVLTPRRWCQVRGRQLSRATVARKPVAGESTKEAVKTIARGMLGVCWCDLTNACAFRFLPSHTRLRAHRAPGIPCAL